MYSNSSILSCASDSFNTQTNFVNSQKRRLRLLKPKTTPCRQKRDLQPARRNYQEDSPEIKKDPEESEQESEQEFE
ncbi:hypothetical protein E4U27_007526 [Claviceps purpurea]|nr:hypothetical protein E4U27_007526 [Claviceps purpurea]